MASVPVHGYLTADELRDGMGDRDRTVDEASYVRAIEAASRQIDDWCSTPEKRRFFWREPDPTARRFNPGRRRWLWVGDFDDTTGLVVRTDDDDDGVFETEWAATDWQAEPLVRINGHPYTAIAAVAAREFPIATRFEGRARVEVVARWGWAAVPPEVAQACQILATAYQRSQHLTGQNLGGDELTSGLGPVALARDLVTNLHVDGPQGRGRSGGGGQGGGGGGAAGGGGSFARRGAGR